MDVQLDSVHQANITHAFETGQGPLLSQSDLTRIGDEVVALFDIQHTPPTRFWNRDIEFTWYWGAQDEKGRPQGRGFLLVKRTSEPEFLKYCYGDFADGQVVDAIRRGSSRSEYIYQGDMVSSRRQGFGRLITESRAIPVYEGGFREGRFHGLGMQREADGELYLGWFNGGRRHGPGMWRTHEGTRTIGYHREGVPEPPANVTLGGTLPEPPIAITHPEGYVIFTPQFEPGADDASCLAAFKEALVRDDKDVLEAIIAKWRQLPPAITKDLMRASDHQGWTVLHFACVGSNADIVTALLSLGAEHVAPTHGVQPLHLACGYGALTRQTLDKTFSDPIFARIHRASRRSKTNDALPRKARAAIAHYQKFCRPASAAVVAALLRAGADPQQRSVFFDKALGTQDVGKAKASQAQPEGGLTAFEMAVMGGHQGVVRTMLELHDGLFANTKLRDRGALFAEAAGQFDILQAIVCARPDPEPEGYCRFLDPRPGKAPRPIKVFDPDSRGALQAREQTMKVHVQESLRQVREHGFEAWILEDMAIYIAPDRLYTGLYRVPMYQTKGYGAGRPTAFIHVRGSVPMVHDAATEVERQHYAQIERIIEILAKALALSTPSSKNSAQKEILKSTAEARALARAALTLPDASTSAYQGLLHRIARAQQATTFTGNGIKMTMR